jgi:hypothetical protein
MTGGDQPLDEVAELADRIAATVTRCPDVAGLTQSPDFPVATYLPGRTVSGVAIRPAEVEICVVARYGPPLPQVAAHVRQAVEPLVPGRLVDVVIADITSPQARPEAGMVSADCHQKEHHNERKTGEFSNG